LALVLHRKSERAKLQVKPVATPPDLLGCVSGGVSAYDHVLAGLNLGWIYLQRGEFSEAFKEYQKAFVLSGGGVPDIADQAYAFAISGHRNEAIKTLEQLKKLSKQKYVSPYLIAEIYAGLGEKDQALEWLEKACDEHATSVIFLKVEPSFDDLRSDPRFQEMVRRIGLQ